MIEQIAGTIALITSVIGLLPQIYKALRTRSTDDISMMMVVNYFICSTAWVIYGLEIDSYYVCISNLMCGTSSAILILQKKYYDRLNSVQLSA